MHSKATLSATSTSATISVEELERQAEGWFLDCEYRQHSERTLTERRRIAGAFLRWLREQRKRVCGVNEIRGFLAACGKGDEGQTRAAGAPPRPVKPGTVVSYYNILRTWFGWMVEEGALPVSPMEKLKRPVDRPDQIQPFSQEEFAALLREAERSLEPRRNAAVLWLLLDTGMRASELCGLKISDLDLTGMKCRVLGKGGKERTVRIGRTAKRALANYLRHEDRDGATPLFVANRGHRPGERLTTGGLGQIIRKLGKRAGIVGVRCSPHTFRHTFAISFLRNGGNVFTLQELLGHESLEMVQRYCRIAQADVENQHRQFSPADRMTLGRRKKCQ